MKQETKLRLWYGGIFLLLVAVEVLIALFVRDRFWRPYGGDIIVMGVLYCFVRIFFPKRLRLLPLFLFVFAFLVEGAQAIDYVSLFGLGDVDFFRILFGTSFSWIDVACYALGSSICLALQELLPRIFQPKKTEK